MPPDREREERTRPALLSASGSSLPVRGRVALRALRPLGCGLIGASSRLLSLLQHVVGRQDPVAR
eukprot:14049154-Alexandrium_andersonii.AAC.1